MKFPNIAKAAGLGTVVLALSAGAAFAAVATASVNVRTGPSTGYRVVDTLRPGEQVAIVDRDGSWCAVQKSGPSGWVSCAYLSDSIRYRSPTISPRVSLSFGFGTQPDRPHRSPWWNDHDHDHDHDWDGHNRPGGSFDLSFSN